MTAQLTERENPELREERVFGDHPTRKVSVEKLITLSQVREVKNSVGPELKDSIDRGDMINQVNIALMSREQLQTYITFVNRVWRIFFGQGLTHTLEDLGSQGEWPSHPELLDWLAVEFRESGWNTSRPVEGLRRRVVDASCFRRHRPPPLPRRL